MPQMVNLIFMFIFAIMMSWLKIPANGNKLEIAQVKAMNVLNDVKSDLRIDQKKTDALAAAAKKDSDRVARNEASAASLREKRKERNAIPRDHRSDRDKVLDDIDEQLQDVDEDVVQTKKVKKVQKKRDSRWMAVAEFYVGRRLINPKNALEKTLTNFREVFAGMTHSKAKTYVNRWFTDFKDGKTEDTLGRSPVSKPACGADIDALVLKAVQDMMKAGVAVDSVIIRVALKIELTKVGKQGMLTENGGSLVLLFRKHFPRAFLSASAEALS